MDTIKKILFIDDNKELVMFMKMKCKKIGINADFSTSFKNAEEKIRKNKYDVVIVDYHLQDGVGSDLCVDCKKIIITSDRNIKGQNVVYKPFFIEDLIKNI